MLANLLVVSCVVSGCARHPSPPTFVVGPVDVGRGIDGIACKGMTRKQILHVLGDPLRARETQFTGKIDPITSDYLRGIYAEAGYFGDHTLCSLTFKLDQYTRNFGGELQVVVRNGDKAQLLSRELTLMDVRDRSFVESLGFDQSAVRIREGTVFIMDDDWVVLSIHFSPKDGRLSRISLGWQK
jgi:hypothetical protein